MKLESYIRNNRETLDTDKPNEELIWAGISHSIENHARKKRIRYLKQALMAAAMIIISFTVGYYLSYKKETTVLFAQTDNLFTKQEAIFVNLINSYAKQIERENVNLETLPTSYSFLKDMDRLIEAYSSDLRQYGPNPELIRSLLDLYEKKIMLLQRMLFEIEKEKNYGKNQVYM